MNASNAKDYLPLVQALADGKMIQIFHPVRREWEDSMNTDFTYDPSGYRVKAEPREWDVIVGNDGTLYRFDECVPSMRILAIRVREILDEP